MEPQIDYYQFEDLNTAVVRLFRDARSEGKSGAVLDLGCGRALLGSEIERLGFRVIGVDSNPAACATARTRISEVIETDLTQAQRLADALQGRQFDWLLAADVLEHMTDPAGALSSYRKYLNPQGRLIVSLPNVAVWDNRMRLFFGRFNYADSGVLDRTHLRFFTFRTAHQLVIDAGFIPLRTDWEPGIARGFLPMIKRGLAPKIMEPGAILESRPYRFYSHYLAPAEHFICGLAPGLLAFRAIIEAGIKDCAEEPSSHRNRS